MVGPYINNFDLWHARFVEGPIVGTVWVLAWGKWVKEENVLTAWEEGSAWGNDAYDLVKNDTLRVHIQPNLYL